MTVAGGQALKVQGVTVPKWALGLGSIAPDIPLYFLTFGGIYYFGSVLQWPRERVARYMFDTLYYEDPYWIAFHNFLHSPVSLILLLACAALALRFQWWPVTARWLVFFFSACMLHSSVDVLTHFDDGPVFFFPFHWEYRFSSPISYWDPKHYGIPFMVFEGVLDSVISVVLLWRWGRSRLSRAKSTES